MPSHGTREAPGYSIAPEQKEKICYLEDPTSNTDGHFLSLLDAKGIDLISPTTPLGPNRDYSRFTDEEVRNKEGIQQGHGGAKA